MRLLFGTFLLGLVPVSAQAAWQQASSPHFIVYADDSERNLRTFAEHLESYHSALEVVTGTKISVPSPSNRVTVFVVGNESQVRRLYGDHSQNIGAFYIPRAGASVAIVPRISTSGAARGDLDFSLIALLHEYAHHFTISSNAFGMPRWVAEGSAEFFASADFSADGGVGLGRPAQHRAGELAFARDVSATELLDPDVYEKHNRGKSFDAFYGKSWLLYHYLTLGGTRDGQLERYLRLLMQGKPLRQAGLEAFGPFAQLDREMDTYLHRRTVTMIKLPAAMLHAGQVEISPLSAGEAAMMPVRIRSKRGVTREQAIALLPEARAVAQRFPGDAPVQSALAEAEFDAGNDSEAIAAADRALALDWTQVTAYVQKGFALFHEADQHPAPGAFAKARAPWVALNRIENDHPLALFYYYRTFAASGMKPPALAVDALGRAVELAPFDVGLRMTLAMQQLRDGHSALAKRNLAPIAYNPHATKLAEFAKEVLARIEAEPSWDGRGLAPPHQDDAGE